jgi:hypothetical protein
MVGGAAACCSREHDSALRLNRRRSRLGNARIWGDPDDPLYGKFDYHIGTGLHHGLEGACDVGLGAAGRAAAHGADPSATLATRALGRITGW